MLDINIFKYSVTLLSVMLSVFVHIFLLYLYNKCFTLLGYVTHSSLRLTFISLINYL